MPVLAIGTRDLKKRKETSSEATPPSTELPSYKLSSYLETQKLGTSYLLQHSYFPPGGEGKAALHKKFAPFYLSKELKKLPSRSEAGEEAQRKSLKLCLQCLHERNL